MLKKFIEQHRLPSEFKATVDEYYQPLAERIYRQFERNNGPYFVGINGCQGSGKSTLTAYIGEYLTVRYQLNIVVMSLDDFYLTSAERKQLAKDIHPLLATRGVPGTHNTPALAKALNQFKSKQAGFVIPKFNKAIDNPLPENQCTVVEQTADIILLEGWCWGVKSQTDEQLVEPINQLELMHDDKATWRNYVNEQLKNLYQPLYNKMDYWLVLQAPSFDCVYLWRLEQEEKLKAKNHHLAHSKIMSAEEVLSFTQYFQRLSVQAINTMSLMADATLYLDENRKITKTAYA